MKRFVCYVLCSLATVFTTAAQIVSIPDPAFKQALLDHIPVIDTNGDNEIQLAEAEALTGPLFVFGTEAEPGNIADLTGLEAFSAIDKLICSYNQLTAIDLSANPSVTELISIGNPLESLDLSQNTVLTSLFVVGHGIDFLDLSPNNNLTELIFTDGSLEQLLLGQKPGLLSVALQRNQLVQIELSGMPAVITLDLADNNLADIDLTENLALRRIFLDQNNLQHLDLSNNADLQAINVASNLSLRSINLQNGNNSALDLSGGSNASNFQNIPGLEVACVDDQESPLAAYIQDQTSQQVSITENCALGSAESGLDGLVVSPNPMVDRVHVIADQPIKQAEVYDITGKLLFTTKSLGGIGAVDMSALKTGLYLLRFSGYDGQSAVKRVIKLY